MMPLLSIVSTKEGDIIYIHADKAGLNQLAHAIEQLQYKLENGECDHTHLLSDAI